MASWCLSIAKTDEMGVVVSFKKIDACVHPENPPQKSSPFWIAVDAGRFTSLQGTTATLGKKAWVELLEACIKNPDNTLSWHLFP